MLCAARTTAPHDLCRSWPGLRSRGQDHRSRQQSPAACASWRRRSVWLDLVAGLPWRHGGDPAGARATRRLGRARHGPGVLVVRPALRAEEGRRAVRRAAAPRPVDSGTSVLGLVQHLAEAERYWFGYHLAGAAWDADRDTAWPSSASRAAADVLRRLPGGNRGQRPRDPCRRRPRSAFRRPGRRQPAHAPVGHGPHDAARPRGTPDTRTSSGSSSTALPVAEPVPSAALAVRRWIKDASLPSPKFARTARRYRTIAIQAAPRTITAADPLAGRPPRRAPGAGGWRLRLSPS